MSYINKINLKIEEKLFYQF